MHSFPFPFDSRQLITISETEKNPAQILNVAGLHLLSHSRHKMIVISV